MLTDNRFHQMVPLILALSVCSMAAAQQIEPDSPRSSRNESEVPLPDADPESPVLPPEWLKDVSVRPDSGLLLTEEEYEPYLRILNHIRNLSDETLEEAARKFRLSMIDAFGERTRKRIESSKVSDAQYDALFRQLEKRLSDYRENPQTYPLIRDAFNQPEKCQGELVSFTGHIRQAFQQPPYENEFGLEKMYQISLFDGDSKGFPVIVICTEVPDNLPLNFPDSEAYDGISVTGYYYRLVAYEGKEDLQAVPLILAKSVSWNPPKPVNREFPDWGYGFLIAVGVVLLWMIVKSNRPDDHLQSVRNRLKSPEDNPFENSPYSNENSN